MPKPNIYVQVDYDQYKSLENQIRSWADIESTHESTGLDKKFYHKALRLDLGEFMIEIQGPIVREPMSAPVNFICVICKHPIVHNDVFRGAGDGRGQSFAHNSCYEAGGASSEACANHL